MVTLEDETLQPTLDKGNGEVRGSKKRSHDTNGKGAKHLM